MALVVCWGILAGTCTWAFCSPIAYNWDTTIPGGHCIDRDALFLAVGIIDVIGDFLLFLLPLPTVWKLQVPRASKLGLLVIFSIAIMWVFSCLYWPSSGYCVLLRLISSAPSSSPVSGRNPQRWSITPILLIVLLRPSSTPLPNPPHPLSSPQAWSYAPSSSTGSEVRAAAAPSPATCPAVQVAASSACSTLRCRCRNSRTVATGQRWQVEQKHGWRIRVRWSLV